MELINNVGELRANLLTLERYLNSYNSLEKDFHHKLIKRGINFVAYKKNDEWFFAPSRFVGYKDNNMTAHKKAKYINGGDTTRRISSNSILNFECQYNPIMENEYRRFSNRLGFQAREKVAGGKGRKFWKI
jgi:hypothetical protein